MKCFILGTAPSLKLEDLSNIKDPVFICNKGYKALELGLKKYDYYVLGDPHVAAFNYKEIEENVVCPKFLSSGIRNLENFTRYKVFKRLGGTYTDLPKTFESGWPSVSTVVLDAVLIAYFLGFTDMTLLGVDLNYNQSNTHFYPDDSREVKDRNVMDIKRSINTYNYIKKHLELLNINLKNNSKGYIH